MSKFHAENSSVYPINVEAMDYLLEPVDLAELAESVRRHPSGRRIGTIATQSTQPDSIKNN